MKIQHFMALVVLSLATVPGARAAVLAGPLTNAANGHAYYLLSANSWTASQAEARGLGGHLVTIDDAAENQWVLNTFFPLTGVPYASLWIGLNDAANEGQFVWANGEPVAFTYWYPGEPNNLGGEHYATIRHPSEVAPTGSWNDLSDTSGQVNPTAPTFGVVELPPDPTPLPAAATQPADQFMPGSARLNGLANPSGSPTLAWFEWGTSLAYGNATPPQSVGSGNNVVEFSNVLIGLVSGTDYHFRARASNLFGLAIGVDQTFNLNTQRPFVTTLAADQLSNTNARLRGQVNPRGWPTAAWFEWGTNTNYGNLIGMQDVGQGSSVSNLNVVLNGLTSGPNYHYRLVATNAFGAAYGADQTFNTTTTTNTWTGADPSGYWSAPANWSPAGVPVNGADLVFPGGLPPEDMVSTNDLTDSIFRSIRFGQASRHTIRGNPITLTNRSDCIVNSGTNVIGCDLTFSGTPPTPEYQYPTIRGSFGSGELTVIGNVGGGSLYFLEQQFGAQSRLVIRGQFTGGSLRVNYGTLALYGDNPNAISAEVDHSHLLVQGSQPNLDIRLFSFPLKTLIWSSLRGDGQVGDVTGTAYIVLDSTLSVKKVGVTYLSIILNGTNVGEYGRLVASGDVSLYGGFLLPSAGFNPQEGQVYTIVEKTSPGPVTRPFFGPEGTITYMNGMGFRVSYVGGDGNDVTLTATDTPPTVTITNPPNGAVFDAPASFTLGAAAADPAGSVTNVQFFLDATSLGNDTSSPYSVPVSGLVEGNYTLTAVASDNAGAHATNSIAITVQPNMPPTVTITNPPNGAVLDVPASFTLGAAAADPGGSVTNVQFFLDATSLGNDTSSPYSVPVSGLVAGNYTLTAVASDNTGMHATNSIAITVQPRTEWDISQDFSLTVNPGGPWSYGYMNVLGGAFSLLTYSQYSPDNNGLMIFSWSKNGYEPVAVYKNQTSQTSISDGGSGTYPPGTIWFYGGIEGNVDNYGVIRFTVPADKAGTYRVETAVRTYLDGPASRDADFWVLRNGTQVFSHFLGPNSGTGYTNIFTLAAGDTIDFVCGRGQDNVIHGSGLKIQASLKRTDGPPPIVLGAVQRFGTQFVFSYSADVGLGYAVERSATLSNWTTLWSNTANVNPMTFTDTTATNRMNFYRVRRLPNP